MFLFVEYTYDNLSCLQEKKNGEDAIRVQFIFMEVISVEKFLIEEI